MSEGRTYVVIVGAAGLVALAAWMATRRSGSDVARVVTETGELEEIEVTARRLAPPVPSSDAPIMPSGTRGIRNHNPGNLVWLPPGSAYNGQVGKDGALGIYATARDGLRAMTLELKNDYERKGFRTIDALITEWAPPHENPTVAYINAVSRRMNVPSNRTLSLNRQTWQKLVRAIIFQENGQDPYTDAQIGQAMTDGAIPV